MCKRYCWKNQSSPKLCACFTFSSSPGESVISLEASFFPFLFFSHSCTPFVPPSIGPPASALSGQPWHYESNTTTATQSYLKNCCLCCLLTARDRSVFPSAESETGCKNVSPCKDDVVMNLFIHVILSILLSCLVVL